MLRFEEVHLLCGSFFFSSIKSVLWIELTTLIWQQVAGIFTLLAFFLCLLFLIGIRNNKQPCCLQIHNPTSAFYYGVVGICYHTVLNTLVLLIHYFSDLSYLLFRSGVINMLSAFPLRVISRDVCVGVLCLMLDKP